MKLIIKETAKKYGLSINNLALKLGIAQSSLSTIINKDSGKMQVITLLKIANTIGCTVNELIEDETQESIIKASGTTNAHNNTLLTIKTICPHCGNNINISAELNTK